MPELRSIQVGSDIWLSMESARFLPQLGAEAYRFSKIREVSVRFLATANVSHDTPFLPFLAPDHARHSGPSATLPAFACHVADVFSLGSSEQVVRPEAAWSIALVARF